MTNEFSGGCLCGQVTYQCSMEPQLVGHCHCVDCRKSSGTGHGTHVIVAQEAVTIDGELKYYDHPADSGNIVSRGFCPTCGCAIVSKNSGMAAMAALRASSMDDPDIAVPQMIVYASRAPKWDNMDPALPSFPEGPEGGVDAVVDELNLGTED